MFRQFVEGPAGSIYALLVHYHILPFELRCHLSGQDVRRDCTIWPECVEHLQSCTDAATVEHIFPSGIEFVLSLAGRIEHQRWPKLFALEREWFLRLRCIL